MRAVGVAEAPGQIGGLGDVTDSFAADDRAGAARRRRRAPRWGRQPASSLSSSPTPSAWVSLPGPEVRSPVRPNSASGVHEVEAFERLNGLDQDRSHASSSHTAFSSEWIP